MRILPMLIIILALGCVQTETDIVCADGTKVADIGDCFKEQDIVCADGTKVADIGDCYEKETTTTVVGSSAHTTTTTTATSISTSSSSSSSSAPRATVTTSTTSTTSTTTTSTLGDCGNGRLDAGEECDPGMNCKGSQGLCDLRPGRPPTGHCIFDNSCERMSQIAVTQAHDMGGCRACVGPFNVGECTCFTEGEKIIAAPEYKCGPHSGDMVNSGQGPHLRGEFFVIGSDVASYEQVADNELLLRFRNGDCVTSDIDIHPLVGTGTLEMESVEKGSNDKGRVLLRKEEHEEDAVAFYGDYNGIPIILNGNKLYTYVQLRAWEQFCANGQKIRMGDEKLDINPLDCFSLDLESVGIGNDSIKVVYGKDFLECANLVNDRGESVHFKHLYCKAGNGIAVTHGANEFKLMGLRSDRVRLCHASDRSRCSNFVWVERSPDAPFI